MLGTGVNGESSDIIVHFIGVLNILAQSSSVLQVLNRILMDCTFIELKAINTIK